MLYSHVEAMCRIDHPSLVLVFNRENTNEAKELCLVDLITRECSIDFQALKLSLFCKVQHKAYIETLFLKPGACWSVTGAHLVSQNCFYADVCMCACVYVCVCVCV